MSTAGPLVDAHLHLWDPRRMDYPWLTALPPLNRPFGPDDLDTGGHELAAAVFVEAGRVAAQSHDEVAWVETIATAWPVLRAVVAHADLERGADVDADLRRLARSPLVRGVRRNLQDEAPGFAVDPVHVEGVRLLARYGFTADLCIRSTQLPAVIELVRRVPEVTFVLDHLGKPVIGDPVIGQPASGKPVIGDPEHDPWREQIRRLAGHPNVVCKLSGLTTEADWDRWHAADLLPYLRHALAEFGAERCMFGGDWPVASLATGYGRWAEVVLEALSGHSDAERDQVLRGTATRVYRLHFSTSR